MDIEKEQCKIKLTTASQAGFDTWNFDVEIKPDTTVQQLIDDLCDDLNNEKSEIKEAKLVIHNGLVAANPGNYNTGCIIKNNTVSEIPGEHCPCPLSDVKNKRITRIRAQGGWGYMLYLANV